MSEQKKIYYFAFTAQFELQQMLSIQRTKSESHEIPIKVFQYSYEPQRVDKP